MINFSRSCRACGNAKIETLIDFGSQPIVHHLLKDKDEHSPEFPFILEGCNNCGFMQLQEVIDPLQEFQSNLNILLRPGGVVVIEVPVHMVKSC